MSAFTLSQLERKARNFRWESNTTEVDKRAFRPGPPASKPASVVPTCRPCTSIGIPQVVSPMRIPVRRPGQHKTLVRNAPVPDRRRELLDSGVSPQRIPIVAITAW